MKVTKEQLRGIIRQAVRQKLERQDDPVSVNASRLTEGSFTFITKDLLATLIDEEYDAAMARRRG